MKDRITRILERWFISEPALFQVLCTHSIEANAQMPCPVRSGARRVEYNPDFLKEMGDEALEQALRAEAIRILLKHPYQRKPDACSQQAVSVGSNITIGDNYHFGNFNIDRPGDYELPGGREYEWYSRRIQELLPPGADSGLGDGSGQSNDSGKHRRAQKRRHARAAAAKAVEAEDPAGNACSKYGPEYDTYGLADLHHARVYETYYHY